MTLRDKTVSGIVWTGIAKMSMQVLLLVVSIILANLLSAKEFGIIGMAALVTVAIGMVNDKGLGTSLIQQKDLRTIQLDSVFWGGLVFAFALFLFFVIAAFPLSDFFDQAALRWVIPVQALGFMIGAFGIVQKALLTKEMSFKKLAIIEIVSVLASAIVSIMVALLDGGVWSLVALVLVRDFVTVFLLWFTVDWHPKAQFSWHEFRLLLKFSAHVLGNDLALYVTTNTDVTIIGRVLGAAMLGYYNWALNLIKLPVTRLSAIVSKVTFPAFSALQDDLLSFKRAYLRSITFISLITFPVLVCLGLFSHEFIVVFLGSEWLPMEWPLVILVPMGMLKSVGTIKGSVLMARGRPDIELKWNVVYFLPLLIFVYSGTHWGLNGVAIAFSTLYLLTFPIIQTITNRQINVSGSEFVNALLPALLAVSGMTFFTLIAKWLANTRLHFPALTVFIVGGLVAVASYTGMLMVFHKNLVLEFMSIIRIKRMTR
jgi:PST family polysaccharide transporter